MKILKTSMIVAVLVLGVFGPSSAEAQSYSNKTIQGTWAWHSDGFIGADWAPSTGLVTFDGRGECGGSFHIVIGGQVIFLSVDAPGSDCRYSVNPDGTGTLEATVVDPVGNTTVFFNNFTILNRNKFFWISTDALGQTAGRGVSERRSGSD